MRKVLLLSLLAAGLIACRKKDDPVLTVPGQVNGQANITFQNVAGTDPLVLDNAWYRNANGDSIKVSEYKYYISNIVLEGDDTAFTEPESYHLIDQRKNDSRSFSVKDIPAGTYTRITFMVGVDRARNTEGAQTGALDPIHGMFWDWKTGYIMAKLEGVSPQSANAQNKVSYHIAGFSGLNSVLKIVTLSFPSALVVKSGSEPNIHIKADMLEWFKTPDVVKISEVATVANTGDAAVRFANNYADMFTVDHID